MGWLNNTIVAFFKRLWGILVKIGNIVKKKILRFAENIASFFKSSKRLATLKANKKILPVIIKQIKDNGGYNVISCLFDEKKDDVVDFEENSQGIECERLDDELSTYFGNKDMIILQ